MTMQKILRYTPPTGDAIGNPPLDFIKEVIFKYNADYWSNDSTGTSMLDFYTKNLNTYSGDLSLIFFFDEPHGFFLYYDVEFVPVKKGVALKDSNVVEHIVGTEPMRVPSICYRTREEAWEILMDFVSYQKMSEKFIWVRLGEIDYQREVKAE